MRVNLSHTNEQEFSQPTLQIARHIDGEERGGGWLLRQLGVQRECGGGGLNLPRICRSPGSITSVLRRLKLARLFTAKAQIKQK